MMCETVDFSYSGIGGDKEVPCLGGLRARHGLASTGVS